MCTRFSPLTREEADRVLAARKATGRATLSQDETRLDPMHDAYPGSKVPVFIPSPTGNLTVAVLSWGFPLEGRQNAVFNTRIETALAQLSSNRRGMWADAISNGRCLGPVRAFYESHGSERVGSEHTGRLVRRQYRFCFPGASAFLLAAIQSKGCFSVITTEPNADVAPIHTRMPLVLGPGESGIWLGPGFGGLADRGGIRLDSRPER